MLKWLGLIRAAHGEIYMKTIIVINACTSIKKIWMLSVLLLSVLSQSVLAVDIRHNKADNEKEAYQLGVLKLALSYDEQNTYHFIPSERFYDQSKMINELNHQQLDVIWMGTKKEYEDQFLPIRVPLYKGLLGHRIFLIRDGDQGMFSTVKSFGDLRSFKAGQGRNWADTKILTHSGLPVVTTNKYKNLFHMLEGGRFDYFPRGVHEPWSEMANHQDIPLQVEDDILLIYPLPAYLFVHKNNTQLQAKIAQGLEQAIEDGRFDAYFFNHPMIKNVLNKANLKNRKTFRIENPSLTAQTPFDDARLWLNIASL